MPPSAVQGPAPGRAGDAPAAAPQAPASPGRAARPGVWLTDLLLLSMALIWGGNFSVLKAGTRAFGPLTPDAPVAFNGLRVLVAAAVLVGIAAAQPRHWPSRRDAWRLVLLGVVGHGLYQLLFIEGIARSSVATSALVLAAGPAFIGIVGRVFGIEHPSRRAWMGIGLQLLGMAGVVLGSAAQRAAPGEASRVLGALLVLAAALTWAFYAVLLKPFTERVHPMQLSAWTLLGGVATLGALAAPQLARLEWSRVPAVGWGAVAYSGLLAMVVAYLFYYQGVRTVGPVRTAMYSNLQPIVAMVVAFLSLGEVPTPWQLGGVTLIMAGLLVSRR